MKIIINLNGLNFNIDLQKKKSHEKFLTNSKCIPHIVRHEAKSPYGFTMKISISLFSHEHFNSRLKQLLKKNFFFTLIETRKIVSP